MLDTILAKVFGTQNERELKKIRPIVEAINALEPSISPLSDAELRQVYRGCLFTLFPSLGRLRARAHHRARSARAGRAGKVMRPASRAGRYFSPDRSSGAAFRRHHGPASTRVKSRTLIPSSAPPRSFIVLCPM